MSPHEPSPRSSTNASSGRRGPLSGDENERLYFRQLLAGRDFAQGDGLAAQMVNYVYAIGDRATGVAVLIDPAYRPHELVELLAEDGFSLSGVLLSHYHADHAGGRLAGFAIAGIAQLLELTDVPVHVQAEEAAWVERTTGVGRSSLVTHSSGDVVDVGQVAVTCLHTPGHTPGSQCLSVEGRLVTGDTLFLQGCGRTDLPGGDPEALYDSLAHRLAGLPGRSLVFPGHAYAPEPYAPLDVVREENPVLSPIGLGDWLARFAS